MKRWILSLCVAGLGMLAGCGSEEGTGSSGAGGESAASGDASGTGSQTGSGGGASSNGSSGSGSSASGGTPEGDYMRYTMTLPDGEVLARTCTEMTDVNAETALGIGLAGEQANLGCPAAIATQVNFGGLTIHFKQFAMESAINYTGDRWDRWDFTFKTALADGGKLYSVLAADNVADDNIDCALTGANESATRHLSGELDCTFSNGATLTADFDLTYPEW